MPICHHIKEIQGKSKEKNWPLWPWWPSYDPLDNFSQLFYSQLIMLLRGAPLKQGYTLAIGCYNLRFYAAESGPLVLRLVHSERDPK